MAELDPFEIRLRAALQSFADRAVTEVDAMAVAGRVVKRRRPIGFAWLGRSVPVPVSILLLLVMLASVGWSMTVGGMWPRYGVGLIPAPSPSPTASPTPTPTPSPSTSSARVTGTTSLTVVSAGTTTNVGNVAQIRGIVVTTTESTVDPRATGNGTFNLSIDVTGDLGFEWGTVRIENAVGAWEGSCSGASWSRGDSSDVTCWLTGGGGYEGLTYYWHGRNVGVTGEVTGVIAPASPPAP